VGHSEGGLIGPLVTLKEPTLRALVLMAGPAQSGRPILHFQLTNRVNQDTTLKGARRDSALARINPTIDSLGANNPWMKFFLDYDPLATARQIRTPVLILNGATDQQVTPEQVQTLVEAFKAAGNKEVTSHVFPAVNHLFIYDPNGSPWGYTRLTRAAVEPQVMGIVVDWLVQRLK
jgi:pimeloyl-ACP methyl ester carboxylesterase